MTDTIKSDKKFTIIFSAKQRDVSDVLNALNTDSLAHHLNEVLHVDFIRAVGVYDGELEQSFIVHTNSSHMVSNIKRYVFDKYNQDSVLVSVNRDCKAISLMYPHGDFVRIGTTFTQLGGAPSKGNYTVLNGTDYYSVF